MAHIQNINADIELTQTFKFIAQAFEEISVMRMRKVRESVVNAREFVDALSTTFYDVKSSYKDKITHLVSKKELVNDPNKKDKKLSVLISANTKLYGEVVLSVFNVFNENVSDSDTDVLIVGRLGKELYEKQDLKKKYLYYEISDSQVYLQDIENIMFQLVKYDNIDVYYAHFENILTQVPMTSNISGDQPFKIPDTSKEEKLEDIKETLQDRVQGGTGPSKLTVTSPNNVKFVFEPDLEDILKVFRTQVFVSLFKQTVHEAHLAHFASRVTAMEQALSSIEKQQKILYSEQRKFKKMVENRKNLERIAGRKLYR
jgi:ATP synthase F1 gamma subunit